MDTKMKIIAVLGAVLIVAGYMAFRNAPSADLDTITIGGAYGLSGNCAEYGEGERDAAQMAADEINAAGGIRGKILKIVVEDTQCENKTTVNAVQKLIYADGVQAMIGPTWGDAYQGAASVIRNAKVVSIGPDTALEALEFQNESVDYLFSTYPPQRAEIAALEGYAKGKGFRRVAMVWDQDSYSTMMVKLFREAAPSYGIAISDEQEMPTGNQDFRTILAKLKADRPDAVFISFLAPHVKAGFLKQAKELGLSSVILSASDIQDASVLASFGKFMDGAIYTYPKIPASKEAFSEKYRAIYKKDPQGPAAANAYDAVRMIAEAFKNGAVTGTEIQEKLMAMTIPGTFAHELRFDAKHQVEGGDFEVKTVRNGAFVSL